MTNDDARTTNERRKRPHGGSIRHPSSAFARAPKPLRRRGFAIRHSDALACLVSLAVALCGCEAFQPMPPPSDVREPAARGPEALESASADARREAALSLTKSRIEDADVRAQVARKLAVMAQSDPEALVRSAALQALLVQNAPMAVDVARRVRADESAMVRWDAVKVLADLGGRPLMPALLEMLAGDPDANVRRECARGLARFDELPVIRALVAALEDADLSVVQAAHDSLVKLSAGVDLGMKPEPWQKWWGTPL